MARWLEAIPLSELLARPAPINAKKHDALGIRASVTRHGFVEAPTIDERTGRLVAGHGRLEDLAIRKQNGEDAPDGIEVDEDTGEWLVPTQRGWASRSDKDASAYLVASNKLTEAGGWDDDLLAQMLGEYRDDADWLLGTGFQEQEVVSFLASLGRDEPEPEPEPELPPAPVEPVSRRGDLWICGEHRLLVGDCRDAGDVKRVLAGEKVNLAFTSPPYADRRDYDESSGFRPIPPDEYVEWFEPVAANVAAHLASDGSWFVNIKAESDGLSVETYVLDLVLSHVREWGWLWGSETCWERAGIPGKPHRRFKNQFESVYQFAKNEWKFRPEAVRTESASAFSYEAGKGRSLEANQGDVGDEWFTSMHTEGMAYPGNRLPTFAGSHEATGHRAAFPVGLPEWFIKAYTDRGDVVLDPFMGSGSTLMACEHQGRKGRGIELSAGYVDTTLRRWQAAAGIKPVLEKTGEPHDFLS